MIRCKSYYEFLLLILTYLFSIGMVCRMVYDILNFGKSINILIGIFWIINLLFYSASKYWIFWLMCNSLAKDMEIGRM